MKKQFSAYRSSCWQHRAPLRASTPIWRRPSIRRWSDLDHGHQRAPELWRQSRLIPAFARPPWLPSQRRPLQTWAHSRRRLAEFPWHRVRARWEIAAPKCRASRQSGQRRPFDGQGPTQLWDYAASLVQCGNGASRWKIKVMRRCTTTSFFWIGREKEINDTISCW